MCQHKSSNGPIEEWPRHDGQRFGILLAAFASAVLLSFNANAWMDDWAPVFKCEPAEVEVLPDATVSNFFCSVMGEVGKWEFGSLKYCKGYRLDLNSDGVKDSVFIIPWMGCGLNAH